MALRSQPTALVGTLQLTIAQIAPCLLTAPLISLGGFIADLQNRLVCHQLCYEGLKNDFINDREVSVWLFVDQLDHAYQIFLVFQDWAAEHRFGLPGKYLVDFSFFVEAVSFGGIDYVLHLLVHGAEANNGPVIDGRFLRVQAANLGH